MTTPWVDLSIFMPPCKQAKRSFVATHHHEIRSNQFRIDTHVNHIIQMVLIFQKKKKPHAK